MEMKRIMIPLDGSPYAEQALGAALRLLGPDSELVLLRVTDSFDPGELATAESYLRELVVRLIDDGCKANLRILVRAGSPSDEIVLAAREKCDLLVLCSHGRSGLARLWYGSVAESVVRTAPCPVWLTRTRPDCPLGPPWPGPELPLRRVLVPLDGSPLAEKALDFVKTWEPAAQARLLLVAATDLPVGLNTQPPASMADYLRARAAELGERQVEAWVEDERAVDSILQVALTEHADLIVMATHGHSGLQRWMEGSVSEKVARRAGCPLVVVRGE